MSSSQTLPPPEGPEYVPCACGHIEPEHEPNAGECYSCDCTAYTPAASADEDFLVAVEEALEKNLLPTPGVAVLERTRDAVVGALAPLVAQLRAAAPAAAPSAPADRGALYRELADEAAEWGGVITEQELRRKARQATAAVLPAPDSQTAEIERLRKEHATWRKLGQRNLERAHEENARLRAVVERVRRLHDGLAAETDLASPDDEITRGAAARKIAAALDGYTPPAAPPVPSEPVDRAAELSPAERTMLNYALNQAQLRMWATGKFTDEDQAAIVSLRRLTDEAQQPETQAEDPARIDRIRPEFTEHASVESIDVQLRRARSQLRRWHLRVEWLISLRQARVMQKERGEWPAAVSQPGKEA